MNLIELLTRDCTQSAVPCRSKKHAFEIISELAAENLDRPALPILEALLNRENIGSTAIGQGIAIPHGRLADLEQATAVLITLQEPLDFDALDGQPVDLLFALLVPEDQCQLHLKTLSLIAKTLNQRSFSQKLRNAKDSEELYELITSA
ncbi:PTS IIA-like nitrogen regulatory protein PtsN [Dongshaea marina]|uniref:PTS IIA-like nitrogen regulatory protein PtsN n=1 Tax=Dongshaea marina TaxID=2047966 RepID=UPI000D3E46C9|nr:PTS IIA-like nitrogen regulatory protein PtsN [Dongshaea marina]